MRRKLWTTLTVLVIGVVLYTLAGFLLAPQLIKQWIETAITADSGGRLEAERIAFNPYTFELSIDNLTLYGTENKAAFSVSQSEATLDPATFRAQRPIFSGIVELTGVETASAGPDDFYLAARRITADAAGLDSGVAVAERLRIDEPELHLRRDDAGALNLPTVFGQLLRNSADSRLEFRLIEVSNGRLRLADDAVSPSTRFDADAVDARLERRAAGAGSSIAASAKGRLAAPAGGEIDVDWQRSDAPDTGDLSIMARGVALSQLSPYASAIVGREPVGGRLDLDLQLEHGDGRRTASLRLAVEALELAAADPERATAAYPIDLAVALLKDDAGTLRIERSVQRASAGAGFDAGGELSRMLRSELDYTVQNPFEILSGIAGAPAATLRRLDFLPGSAEPGAASKQALAALAGVLERRPALGLAMRPVYDPVSDRAALARQQVRLHVTLAASARPPGQAGDAAPDFSDEKVRAVLDEFASTRLPASTRSAIARANPEKGEAYYRAVFEALVVNQDVDEAALQRLARYRVQSAIGELAGLGVDAARLVRRDGIDVSAGSGRRISVEIEPFPAGQRTASSPSSALAPDANGSTGDP